MIVLYNPRSTQSPHIPLPLSLLNVASALEGVHAYTIVDGNVETDPVAAITDLAKRHPLTAIGMSVMPGPQLNQAVPDCRALKRALPDVPMIWGGYFASQHYALVLEDGAIDICVRGQGEATILELIDVLTHGGDLGSVAGIDYRLDGSVHHTPNRDLVPLDDFADAPYHRLPVERYLHSHYLGERVAAHQTSYGCPFACNFCAIVSIVNRRWVGQAPERVAGVFEYFKRSYGADAMQLYDMDYFIKEDRVEEISERITPYDMSWWALGRVDELMRYREKTWETMAKSGLKMVFCGAEAGDPEALKRMNKGGKVSPDLTIELARRMRKYGVVPEFSFVLGSPPDPMSDIERTIGFIRKIKEVNPATEVILYMYTPVPQDGTLLDEARDLGFRFPQTLDEWVGDWADFSLRRDPKQNPWLNPALQRKVRNFERVLNAYYPTTTDMSLQGVKRMILRALGAWRYKTQVYGNPIELRAFHKLFHYQRPETSGF